VVNLQSTYHITKHVQVFGRLVNLFDKQYATAGFLTSSSFNPNGTFIPNPNNWPNGNAVSPAAPREIWVGMRVQWE
jgi:outer membrane receptor protein involved in Fe transport